MHCVHPWFLYQDPVYEYTLILTIVHEKQFIFPILRYVGDIIHMLILKTTQGSVDKKERVDYAYFSNLHKHGKGCGNHTSKIK